MMDEKMLFEFLEYTRRMIDSKRCIDDLIKKIIDEQRRFDDNYSKFEDEYRLLVYELLDKEPEEETEEETEIPCFVYYILNEEKDKVKIGVSNNPIQRAKNLQTASGEEISIYHTIEFNNREEAMEAETFLHKEFSPWRKRPSKVSRSCEWFDIVILCDLMTYFKTAEKIRFAMNLRDEGLRKATEEISYV